MKKTMDRLKILRIAKARAHQLVDDCSALSEGEFKRLQQCHYTDEEAIADLAVGILQEAVETAKQSQ